MTISQADKFALAFGDWIDTYVVANPSVTFEDLVVGAALVSGTITDLIRERNTQHAPPNIEDPVLRLILAVNSGRERGRLRPDTPQRRAAGSMGTGAGNA